ncbi:MAG TPA: hypothetical protein VMW63_05430 [Methanoregulaceae archaeon]|nr:hypothetical protein [Methanoregulaceae archaeon]
MDSDDIRGYVASLERRVEILGNENAALTVTMNKLMMENMKLKSDIKAFEKKIAEIQRPNVERTVKFD